MTAMPVLCGIHSLAMVGRYYGLRVREGALAAAADLRNTGSSRGRRVFDLYHAAAEEVGMKAKVSSSFDFDRVRQATEEGRPVIVWRRVSLEREKAHAEFAEQFAADPGRQDVSAK